MVIRRWFVAVCLSVAAAVTAGVVTAPPANAAVSYVTACARHTTGAAYTYDQTALSGRLKVGPMRNVNGCLRWTLPAPATWTIVAVTRVGRYYWVGKTRAFSIRPGRSYNMGTYLVYEGVN